MGFVKEQRENTYFFTVPSFTATNLVAHGYTCRLGGASAGDYASLNLAFHVGDDPVAVRNNRRQVVNLLGSSLDRLVAAEQVHGRNVHVVESRDGGRGSASMEDAILQTDALITNVPGMLLSMYYADCVSIFLLDPVKKAVALAHAGWKGTLQQVARETVHRMREVFGSDPGCCLAAIGPSIGPCCFQVDRPVFEQFAQTFTNPESFCLADGQGKWQIDLPKLNQQQLIRAGIPGENITQSNLCTACNHDIFFSHRQEQGQTGRQAALIMLKEGCN
ncbi:peptidoglycan editing factor PgeF [Candidatus Formimonas warabiya]|uniref:Purine nucleoside phosphorylase n=1 Tax=Formimonas warabiya TaxID=1761012 RepID=A0A3G1KR83_FORW1|nr:peptidoglycan editing factor PgeF [Candidatus Formimonas warabiya]ATW24950.1 hypothetical protein DCMF_09350 [Candidatus Formimonas warabiya]